MSEEINQGWQNTPQLNKLAASQQGGNRGAQLWGVQFNGTVNTIYQITPGGSWSQWMGNDWAGPGFPNRSMSWQQHNRTTNACSSGDWTRTWNSGPPVKVRRAVTG
jgi:hypothetical protein